jgi:thymidylate kinase
MVATFSTRRVAVVGLDGCGKSSVISRLRELSPTHSHSFASITCPDFHGTKNAPLQALSKTMKVFSNVCDEVRSPEMKALSMYLQMTLYGPVEQFFIETFAPEVLVCERHPLVETFVYGPLYRLLASSDWDDVAVGGAMRSALGTDGGDVFDSVLGWHVAESRRLGAEMSLRERFDDVGQALAADFSIAVADFGRRYRTTLPDVVLWLDVSPKQAAQRCAARTTTGATETHETLEFLTILRQEYLGFSRTLADRFPHVQMHVIDTGDGADLDSSVQACVTEGRLFG